MRLFITEWAAPDAQDCCLCHHLVFAAVNRFLVTPRLALVVRLVRRNFSGRLRPLTRNSVIEIALGFAIFFIVGMLGRCPSRNPLL